MSVREITSDSNFRYLSHEVCSLRTHHNSGIRVVFLSFLTEDYCGFPVRIVIWICVTFFVRKRGIYIQLLTNENVSLQRCLQFQHSIDSYFTICFQNKYFTNGYDDFVE